MPLERSKVALYAADIVVLRGRLGMADGSLSSFKSAEVGTRSRMSGTKFKVFGSDGGGLRVAFDWRERLAVNVD